MLRKPAEKTEDKKTTVKKTEPVLTNIVQVGDQEFDISDIAAKAYKAYKSVYKCKVVTDFKVYAKPKKRSILHCQR